jgi:LmbE family N-acetylglucosaminyl deacetylase
MRALFVHAHFDDFEFTAAGTFALWQRARGQSLQRRILICTDGCAGHHFRTREETGRMRRAEQAASARIGQYDWQLLALPDGQAPREACLEVNKNLLAGLWKAIRDFEPDYLFCPGLPSDSLAGVHIDHVAVADAVRKVAYMVNVPHAFTPEFPADERESRPVKVPVILNVWDPYTAGANSHDLAVDIEPVFKDVCEMSWCHQSQIMEWLPWVGRHAIELPQSTEDWERVLRARFAKRNRDLGIKSDRPFEVFTVTGWGETPKFQTLLEDLPKVAQEHSNIARLDEKLRRFGCL